MRSRAPLFAITLSLILLVGSTVRTQQTILAQSRTSSSGTQGETASRARITFSETLWDFGYVPKTGKVVHTYEISSVGEDTLFIAKVRTTCGCTSAPLSKEILAPGEKATLDVIFDPAKVMVGETTKRLHVVCNDPNNPLAEIRFSARIGHGSSLVRITPAFVDFDSLSSETQTLIIENTSGEKLSMTRVEGPAEGIELDLKNQMLQPGESIQATLTLQETAKPGSIQTSLTLDFECSKVARVTVPISSSKP